MLQSESLQSFDETYLVALHERYTRVDQIEQIKKLGNEFLFDFALMWPSKSHFVLTMCMQSS